MAAHKLYYANDKEIYLKLDLSRHAGKCLYSYFYPVSARSTYSKHPQAYFQGKEFCLYGTATVIQVILFLPGWEKSNTKASFMNYDSGTILPLSATYNAWKDCLTKGMLVLRLTKSSSI